MKFFRSALLALASAAVAIAQSNPFVIPTTGLATSAGSTLNIQWTPTTTGTVTLLLRSGASNNLDQGTAIASSISNSGSYAWSVPSDILRGSTYTIEIVDDTNAANVNYTPQFVIDSPNNVASTTASTASASATTLTSSAASSSTDSASTASSTSGSLTSSSSATASSSSSTDAASASTKAATTTSKAASTTSAAVATQSTGLAPRATAMAAGMIGVVALGAIVL